MVSVLESGCPLNHFLGSALVLGRAASAGGGNWWSDNWFSLVQSVGIVASLLVAAIVLRADIKARRAGTLMQMTQYHREIWGRTIDNPRLRRVMDAKVDIHKAPITETERMFCLFLILHLFASYEARKAGVFRATWDERRDLHELFNLPIPSHVWDEVKSYQRKEFVEFVEDARRYGGKSGSASR